MNSGRLPADRELAPSRRRFPVSISGSDLLAILLSLAAVLATGWVSRSVYQHLPHIEDEMAYVWQAQVIEH